MDIVYAPQKSIAVIRWPIDEFFQDEQDPKNLESDPFLLNGLSSKFYLRVIPSNQSYHLYYDIHIYYIRPEKEVKYTARFWLEDVDGKKWCETQGMYL
jgi:hypothetical protein